MRNGMTGVAVSLIAAASLLCSENTTILIHYHRKSWLARELFRLVFPER